MNHLIPYPAGPVRMLEGSCSLRTGAHLASCDFSSCILQPFLQRLDLAENPAGIPVNISQAPDLPAEGYRLWVDSDGMEIAAGSERGAIWALATAAQLADHQTIPCCEIRDEPLYGHRGLHLDCARHFFDAQEVKKIVDAMSMVKMNVLHWHLSDDQGWRIESHRFPQLHETSKDYYTQEEIRDVVKYAASRGVEILPEIDMPGHTTGLLAACPEHSCTGQPLELGGTMGIYMDILCPGKESTFEFLESLLEEIVPLFDSPRFHIGGDEAPKARWKTCPDCQHRMKEEGLKDLNELQGYFTRRVEQILQKLGKNAVCWNDTLLASNAPKNVQIQYWTLQHREAMEPFVSRGGKWVYSDMFELYLDYPHSMTSLKKVYETKPHLGKRTVGKADGLMGMECCIWTEHVENAQVLEERLFPRALALAEQTWNGTRSYSDFEARLKARALQNWPVRFAPEEKWNPKGKARRQEALAYFKNMNGSMSDDMREQTVESAQPNKEFASSFMKKFFKTSDIPFLLTAMMKN